jgi:hypothetical protein
MKSTLLLGTALLMSVGAIAHAQDMGGSTPPSDPMTNPTDPMANPSAPMPSTPETPAPTTDPSATTAPAPAPSSATPVPPAPAAPDTAAMVTPAPATQDYPLCSATITDQCMQPSEAPRGYSKKKGMKRR